MRLTRLMAPVAAAALLVSACSGGGATPAPTAVPSAAPSVAPSAAGGGDTEVLISGFAFNPAELSTSGGRVTWTNKDDAPHTVTFDDVSITSSGNLAKGQTFSATFAGTATYTYKCTIHSSMTGKITVK